MNKTDILSLIFWGSGVLLVYTFVGYAVIVSILAKIFRRRPALNNTEFFPSASVVLVACNEETRIVPRLRNLLESDYPKDKLEIVVVSDGSTDRTVECVKELNETRVRLIAQNERRGKANGLNIGIAAARGDIIFFADARQRFAPDALRKLARNFQDRNVGAVSGNHTMDTSASNVGGGVDVYWRLEKKIRHAESIIDSSVGCTGAIYAIRREVFDPLPVDTILDDVVTPMRVAIKGYRVLFEDQALCFDPQASEPEKEKGRKLRTLAGNFQMLFRYPGWLLPWRDRLWWALISHKYMRLAAPLFLVLMFASNGLLASQQPYKFLFAGQLAFYTLALAGFFLRSIKLRVLSVPAGFCFLNLTVVGGFWNYMRGTYRTGRW